MDLFFLDCPRHGECYRIPDDFPAVVVWYVAICVSGAVWLAVSPRIALETLMCGDNSDGDLYMSRENIHKASPAGIEGRCVGIQFRYRRTVVTGYRLHLHKSQGKTTSAEDKYVPKDHDQPQNRAATMTRQKVGGRSRQRIRLLRKTYVQCRSGSRLFPKSLTW